MHKYDFVLLVETFVQTDPERLFVTHDVFVCPGLKLSESIHGRLCGGLAFLVKKELKKYIEQIHLELDNFIAFRISRDLLGFEKDCVVIGVYLPPENSKYYQDTDIYNGVTMLEDGLLDICHRVGDIPVIVLGDLNARTASRNSCLSRDPIDDICDVNSDNGLDEPVSEGNKRYSKDSVVNPFGKYLLGVCDEFQLSIVNGIERYNFSPDFTYVSESGCSVIDLFIVSQCLLDKCLHFNVLPMIESKHAAVELAVKCSSEVSIASHSDKLPLSSLKKYQWISDKAGTFHDILQSDQVTHIIDEASGLIEHDFNFALTQFNKCFELAGECMLKTVHVGTEIRRVWFDLECRQSRFVLRQHLRKFNRSTGYEDKLSYIQKRREYKDLLKKKKQNFKDNFLETLHLNLNNAKKFWDSIRTVRPRSTC